MKRILKTWILTMMLCLGSFALFSQAASAYCSSCSYNTGYGYNGYHHGFRHHGYGRHYGCGYKYFNCKTYTYDCCSGCYYPVVTTYRTCTVPYQACSYDSCCCPRWCTYYKRYTYAVKTVKYHCPVRTYCNPCAPCCNSCY